jgi:hypothetical protein
MRLVFILLALAVLTALPAVARGTAADNRVYVPIGCGKIRLVYKPRAMCLGNGGWFRRITWETYGGRRAIFQAQELYNTCKPTCVEGRSYWKHVRLSVSRVRWACGKRVYTRLGAFRMWVPGYDRCPFRKRL